MEYLLLLRGVLEGSLDDLRTQLCSLQHALECMQDFTNLDGAALWQRELSRVVSANLSHDSKLLAATALAEGAVAPLQPAPAAAATAAAATAAAAGPPSFLGRLAGELLRTTCPLRTAHHAAPAGWYDGAGQETLGISGWRGIYASLGVPGLRAVDRLLGLRTAAALRAVLAVCAPSPAATPSSAAVPAWRPVLAAFSERAGALGSFPDGGPAVFADTARRLSAVLGPLTLGLATLGQAQLLRRMAALELRMAAGVSLTSLAPKYVFLDFETLEKFHLAKQEILNGSCVDPCLSLAVLLHVPNLQSGNIHELLTQ